MKEEGRERGQRGRFRRTIRRISSYRRENEIGSSKRSRARCLDFGSCRGAGGRKRFEAQLDVWLESLTTPFQPIYLFGARRCFGVESSWRPFAKIREQGEEGGVEDEPERIQPSPVSSTTSSLFLFELAERGRRAIRFRSRLIGARGILKYEEKVMDR